MPEQAAAPQSWTDIISGLEADLEVLKAGDAPPNPASGSWTAPTVTGPLPDEYANHVRALIEQQREVITVLEEARRRAGEHLVAVRAAETRVETAVYLDVEG